MHEDQLGAALAGVVAAFLGPVLWVVTARAASGRLRLNPWVGIRTARTMGSEQAWLVGHRAALPAARRTAAACVTLGLVAAVLALAGWWRLGLGTALAACVLVLLGAVLSVRMAHRAIEREPDAA